MEHDSLKKIVLLEEQVSASLEKVKANWANQIAVAKEALKMEKTLNIENPTTIETLAQRLQGGKTPEYSSYGKRKAAIITLSSRGGYLTTFIETLENRKSTELYLPEINNLREKFHIIKNDQALDWLH